MKQLFLFTICSLLISTVTFAQSNNSETREVDRFDKISVSAGIDVFVKQGAQMEVVVKTSADLMDKVVTEVKGSELQIKMQKGNYRSWGRNTDIDVYVTMPDLKGISASGGSDFTAEGLKLSELSISASGGSDIELDLDVDQIDISCSGGSDVRLGGTAQDMKVSLSGGADLSARKLRATNCEISTSGGADADINVTGKLSMSASGASNINYEGNPQVLSSKSSGAADIRAY